MHDRRKAPKGAAVDAAEHEQTLAKIQAYRALVATCTHHREARDHSPEALAHLAKLHSLNPDYYTMWNYRREILTTLLADAAPPARGALITEELLLNARIITEVDPKSYATWFHRKWLVQQYPTAEVLTNELRLCAKGLNADERNFHCWGYRRWVAALLTSQGGWNTAKEMEYTRSKVGQNFSNYSAWHDRALTLAAHPDPKVLGEEFELVSQALYTDSKDQSGWIYAHWLAAGIAGTKEAIEEETELYKDLLSVTPGAKWPLFALANAHEQAGHAAQAEACWRELGECDPQHRGYYAWRLSRLPGSPGPVPPPAP